MPSFDVVSRVDMAEVENALNNTRKAILQRFDFKGAKAELTFDQKEKKIHVVAEDGGKMEAIKEMFWSAASKRGLAFKAFKYEDALPGAGGTVKRDITVREGLEMDLAKSIVKLVKETGLKVQASIQGDEIRVTAKKIDDLQAVMAMLRGADVEAPLQFVNMKS